MSELQRKVRCAVYTRKSTEEGLEQEFNTLDAQREACENYIASQRGEGWVLHPDQYDDGGQSGGSLERPALKRLLADIKAGRVNMVVVYKVDRLTRSLMDFAKLVEVFNAHGVTFVSVTQQFNTTTSMGRLTLNMMLSFAQFEREIIGERIRDKIAASRRRGIWMGGNVPLGYDVKDRKLVVNEPEANAVRWMFERFVQIRSMVGLMRELKDRKIHTKAWTTGRGRVRQGRPYDKIALRRLLTNRVYLGEAVHKGAAYPGEHHAIISPEAWAKVEAIFKESPRKRAAASRAKTPFLLQGLMFVKATGKALVPTFTRKKGRLYRYYVSTDALKRSAQDCPVRRVPAAQVEDLVVRQIRSVLRAPEIIAKTWLAGRAQDSSLKEQEVRAALIQFDQLWDELFPAEQTRVVQLLVERIDLDIEGMDLRLRVEGIHSLVEQMRPTTDQGERAA